MKNLEKALLKIIFQAMPEVFLKPSQNQYSNGIDTPIQDIYDDLMTTDGVVPEEDLVAASTALMARVFDISQPLVVIYKKMDNLQQLATVAGLLYTDAYFVNLGICLIKNMNKLDKGLTEWFEKNNGQKLHCIQNTLKDRAKNIETSMRTGCAVMDPSKTSKFHLKQHLEFIER